VAYQSSSLSLAFSNLALAKEKDEDAVFSLSL